MGHTDTILPNSDRSARRRHAMNLKTLKATYVSGRHIALRISLITCSVLLSACAQQPTQAPKDAAVEVKDRAPLPPREFETETLYSLMVAELEKS